MNSLNHLAIIMDGNGRWAKARGHNRIWGHIRGARVAREVIQYAVKNKLPCLSLFAFSTENWQRPNDEVNFLMRLLARNLKKELKTLIKNNVKFHCVGVLDPLPPATKEVLQEALVKTQSNTGMDLVLAVNYSGQQDLTQAVKSISQQVQAGELSTHDINESTIAKHLSTSHLPDPDLIVRTSGELRISNFYLWQGAYSELYFTPTLWPDFKITDLEFALHSFYNKERRFGCVSSFDPNLNSDHNFETYV